MSIVYEVTWYYNLKSNPYPADEFPPFVDVEDMELRKSTSRQQIFRYELADEQDAYRLERGLDQAPSCVRYRRMERGKVR